MNYEPHQRRVIKEAEELADRIDKLEAFLSTDLYLGLPDWERTLLTAQLSEMRKYLSILAERIFYFSR